MNNGKIKTEKKKYIKYECEDCSEINIYYADTSIHRPYLCRKGLTIGEFDKLIHNSRGIITKFEPINIDKCQLDIINYGDELSVLDIGCNGGVLGANIAQYVNDYIGFDFNKKNIESGNEFINEYNIPNMMLYELTDFNFNFIKTKFDIIVSETEFTHVEEETLEMYIMKVNEWLKDEGFFTFHFNICDKNIKNGDTKYYTEQYITDLLKKHNLQIVDKIIFSVISNTKYGVNYIGNKIS